MGDADLGFPVLEALQNADFRVELEAISNDWFGSTNRLTACFVLRHTTATMTRAQIEKATGLAQSTVFGEVTFLTSEGIITSHQPERIYFHARVAEHPFWALFDHLVVSKTSWASQNGVR